MKKVVTTKVSIGSKPKREESIRSKQISLEKGSGGVAIISSAESSEGNHAVRFSPVSDREKIALLAYMYWEQRGCQGGSPEEDWYRAEREIIWD